MAAQRIAVERPRLPLPLHTRGTAPETATAVACRAVRTRALGSAAALAAAVCALGALSGCSLAGGTAKTASATSTASPAASATSSYAPLTGPDEAPSQLPETCGLMLSSAQLQSVFGAGLPLGENYGSYAALANIGRTGRVACIYGVGTDSFGQQSTGSLEVSIATYSSASNAVGRAADTVRTDSAAGATTAQISVGGHPATIVVEQTAVGASSAAAPSPGEAGAAAPASLTSATAPGAPAASSAGTSSAAASPAVANGETELVMADGNRTFVLQIPFAKLSSQQAVTVLTRLALEVYQNTLPHGAGSGAAG